MKQLKLEVIFGSKNKLSPALKMIVGSSNAATVALKKTRDQLRDLEKQQDRVATFRKLKEDVKQATQALEVNKRTVTALKQQLATNPSSKLSSELKKAEAESKRLNKVVTEGRPKLMALRQELNAAGLKSTDLAQHQEELRLKILNTNSAISKQQQHLKTLGLTQQQYQKHSSNVRSAAMYGTGAAFTGAGVLYSMRKPIEESKGVDTEQNRIASLGLGKEATAEAINYARAMKTFGTSTRDNLQLVRDGVTAFADVHHAKMVAPTLAKMKFANEAMFGNEHGEENERKFMDMLKVIELRNGLKSQSAFNEQANIIQQVITATGGRVQANEWLNAIKTGGVAVKGLTNEAFYYKMEPIVQELGGHRFGTSAMSAYQNIYQGRTTKRAANNMLNLGLIADPSKVQHDKAGQISFLDVGAIKGASLFKKDQFAWMEQVLLPTLAAKGITSRDQIHDAIGSIFTNRNASNLFTTMYDQREQIHKNTKLNKGAFNIDQLNEQAKGSTAGKELEAKAKLNDAYLKFGQTILPVYTKAIETATSALQSFTGWMERNPTLAKALGYGILFIATSLIAIGGALAIFSPLILGMLSLRLIMASTTTGASVLSKTFNVLPTIFNIFKNSLFTVGRVFSWLGRALLTNPIGLAITAIGVVAYLIYKNWAPIKSFFMDLWNGVKNAFNTGITFIKGIIQSVDQVFADNPLLNLLFPLIGIPRLIITNWSSISGFFGSVWTSISTGATNAWNSIVSYFGPIGEWFAAKWEYIKLLTSVFWSGIKNVVATAWNNLISVITNSPLFQRIVDGWTKIFDYLGSLKNKMLSIGKNIIDGLVNGIQSGFDSLKSIWAKINSYMPSFMKQKMDIHSPSRVMASLGGHIMSGIGVGLETGFPDLKDKFTRVLQVFNPNAAAAVQKIDVAPALSKVRPAQMISSSQRGDIVVQGDTITLHIHQAPGQNLLDLQRMVENLLNKRDQQKLARVRNSFLDQA
ncbi:TPA: phage tail tape measure protein [Acinetobacter baumannii]|nr:phage tail tape measure protein [Acinetobacter baumannii]